MVCYLLDANAVIVFQLAGRLEVLADAASTVSMAMVDDVRDELTLPKLKSGRPKTPEMREAERVLGSSAIEVIEVLVGSREDAIRAKLRERNVGAGEAASIAAAMHREERIVVTSDVRAAAGSAKLYRELPGAVGRIIGVHSLLRTLVERGSFRTGVVVVEEVALAAEVKSGMVPPLWWVEWMTAVSLTPSPQGDVGTAQSPAGTSKQS